MNVLVRVFSPGEGREARARPDAMALEASPQAIQRALVDLVARARAIDVRPHEGASAETSRAELVPAVAGVLQDALSTCAEVLERFDDCPNELDGFGAPDDGTASGLFYANVEQLLSGQSIADIAFLGMTELRQKMSAQRIETAVDGWDVVAECGSTLRRIAKTMTALELALARSHGLEPQLGFESELGRSIEVRRQYARLRQTVLGEGEPTDLAGLRHALRRAGTAIAMLVGRDIYPNLRIPDRRELRSIQNRIIGWLRDEDAAAGVRLWQDLLGFVRLVAQVNRRQELVDHDARMLRRLLDGRSEPVALDLRALRGLDDELDGLLDAQATWELLRPVLVRLAERYDVSAVELAGERAS